MGRGRPSLTERQKVERKIARLEKLIVELKVKQTELETAATIEKAPEQSVVVDVVQERLEKTEAQR